MRDISDEVSLIETIYTPDLDDAEAGKEVLTIRLSMAPDAYDRWKRWGHSKGQDDEFPALDPMEMFWVEGIDGEKGWHLEGQMLNGKRDKYPPSLILALWGESGADSDEISGNATRVNAVDHAEYATELEGTDATPGVSRIRVQFERAEWAGM
jgi:hypothetical protein